MIEPPALLMVPVLPDSVSVPVTVIVPPLLLVMPPALGSCELRVSPLAMVIAAELVMPLLAVMLPPVTAIIALLLLVTAPVSVPEPLICVLVPELVIPVIRGAQSAAREVDRAASAVADVPPVSVPSPARSPPELIVIEPPALLMVPLFPDSVSVPET